MRRFTLGLAFAALAAAVPSSMAYAQEDTTVTVPTAITRAKYDLRIKGGPTFVDSDFFKTGWHLGGSVRGTPQGWPVGLQLDLIYHELGEEDLGLPADEEDLVDSNFLFIGANAVIGLSTASPTFDPYLIGGVGLYDGDFGINGGVGADLNFRNSPVALFVEFRIHRIFGEGEDLSLFPLSAGVRFGL